MFSLENGIRIMVSTVEEEFQKVSLLYNSLILTNCNCGPLILMFCGKTTNDIVNSIYKHTLRVLLNDYDCSFKELLNRNDKVTIHEKSAKTYARGIQMYDVWEPLLSMGVVH